MHVNIEIEEFLSLAENLPVIDVRAPVEYRHAHIPGAFNIPLFTDEERVKVGTTYKKTGRDEAILQGLEIVGVKLGDLVRQVHKLCPEKKVLVHCWRGGMRSSSMAWLLDTAGFETKVLKGGYKTFRQHVKKTFASEARIVILGGMTGSGKTSILKELKALGQQFVDLEKLANHKGSAFGALGQEEQCSTEHFENLLFSEWQKLDINSVVWLEDESQAIGKIRIPEELFPKMRNSPLINVIIPKELRIEYLYSEYGNFNLELLLASVSRIKKRLGGLNTQLAIESIHNHDIKKAIDISLLYYDKAYLFGLSKRDQEKVFSLELNSINPKTNAKKILTFYQELKL